MRRRTLKSSLEYYAMLLPGLACIFVFHYILLYGVIIAFEDYSPVKGFFSDWVGLENFRFIFRQPGFLKTIWNSFYIAVNKIILGIIIPVTFSLLLNELGNKLKRTYQTIIYMPHFLSWVVLAGVLKDFLAKDGLLNQVIQALGGQPVGFLTSPSIFPWTMILSASWKDFGFGTVVYMAALTSIDPELYESARIDGASRWRQAISISLPLMMPIVMLKTVLSIGGILSAGFDQIFNMYAPIVYETGDIIDTYVYRLGIIQAQYSISTAVGLFRGLIGGVLVCVSYYLADRFAGYRIW